MIRMYDLAIIGAGPAGLSAAVTACRYKARVLVLDNNMVPGGQLIKQTHKFFGSHEHRAGERGYKIGLNLLEEVKKAGCEVSLNTRVYGICRENGQFLLGSIAGGKNNTVLAKAVIVATGAVENPLAFSGWTLPGVITAGAAQTMVNLHRVLPGKRVLMIGAGNVGLIVAYQLLQAGMEIAAVLDVLPDIGGYQVHAAKLKRAGIPLLTSHTIVRAWGAGSVEGATICGVDENFQPLPGTERDLAVDTICLAVGLSPLNQLVRLAGAEVEYSAAKGGFVPRCDAEMGTTVAGLFAAGDLTGIEEASVAIEEGRLAGLAAAEYLGLADKKETAVLKESAFKNLAALRMEQHPAPGGESKQGPVDRPGNGGKGAESKFRVVVDCFQEIPCNPCESACPTGAIKVGTPIYNKPVVDQQLCIGCCRCVSACPGLACYIINYGYKDSEAAVALAYEYLPLPEKGARVEAVDGHGAFVCPGKVITVLSGAEDTKVVKISVPGEKAHLVKGIRLVEANG